MGFSGAEAFRGTSAPTLKAEVSGKGDNGFFFSVSTFFCMYSDVSMLITCLN